MPPATVTAPVTLVRYLVDAGFGSRRTCATLITGGGVRVNEVQITSITHALAASDRIEVAGKAIEVAQAKKVYLLAHKPTGYISAVRDDRGRPTVMNLVPKPLRVPGLVPAGRLDLYSSGLMVLTNDGDLVHRLTHPSFGVEKEYHVATNGPLSREALRRLKAGVMLEGGKAQATSVRMLDENTERKIWRYAIVMVEGRKREVREMVAAVGQRVSALQRVRIGKWRLRDMTPGEVKEIPAERMASTADAHPPQRSPRRPGPPQARRGQPPQQARRGQAPQRGNGRGRRG